MDGASLPGREKWRPALFGAASYRGTEAARGSQIFIGLLCQVLGRNGHARNRLSWAKGRRGGDQEKDGQHGHGAGGECGEERARDCEGRVPLA